MSWWPGWNSIDGAAKWGDIFFWTGFAFLVLLAGCEVLSKVYSWRKDTLITMRDDLTLIARDAQRRESEPSRVFAPEHYEPQVAVVPPPVAAQPLKADPDPEPELQAPPSAAAPDPEPVARSAEQVARLQERSPRGLGDAQKKAIVGILSQFRGQKFSVVCIAGDAEGKNIGQEIVNVLRAAGWDFPEGGVAEATYAKEPIGLSLMVNAGQIMTPSVLKPVAMLVKAFADAGLMQRNGALADPNIPRDRIEVRVGRNRNPA